MVYKAAVGLEINLKLQNVLQFGLNFIACQLGAILLFHDFYQTVYFIYCYGYVKVM